MPAGRYNLLREFVNDDDTDNDSDLPRDVTTSPHWVIAVARLALPLSYSRKDKKSITEDSTEGAKLRGGKLMIITDDATGVNITASKESHTSTMSLSLIQSDTNYLTEILPGDWIAAWIVHGQERQRDLIKRIRQGVACNKFDDGFKFLGRVESIRKQGTLDRQSGQQHTRYGIQSYGFRELDTQIFYDHFLSSNSIEANNLGRWLARVGLNIGDIFSVSADGQKDNVCLLIPAFLELLVGRGISASLNSTDNPALQQVTAGGPSGGNKEAPFAYLVPKEIGDLLGKTSRDVSKAGGILAYADIIELLFGVQKYTESGSTDPKSVFSPDIALGSPLTKGNQKFTGTELMGAFLPLMPDFDNRPLWNVLQQFLNPVVNEMYTALRVNEDGDVVPTIVLRQIPFTTPVLAKKIDDMGPFNGAAIPYTGYMDLPRWVVPGVLITDFDVGRSDASRCNFVHVYGQSSNEARNLSITDQLVQNQPIRDDFDIQRSGLHTFMSTVACRAINEVGHTPGIWMELIADHRIGSQYTLNGTLQLFGIQAPICQGDNLEFDKVVYHIESVSHHCNIDPNSGTRSWTTSLTVTNGLRLGTSASDTDSDFPIYPGFREGDNTAFDPGVSVEQPDDAQDDPDDPHNGLPPLDDGDED